MLTSRGPVEDNKLTVHVMSEVGVTKSLSQFSDSAEANDIRLVDAGRLTPCLPFLLPLLYDCYSYHYIITTTNISTTIRLLLPPPPLLAHVMHCILQVGPWRDVGGECEGGQALPQRRGQAGGGGQETLHPASEELRDSHYKGILQSRSEAYVCVCKYVCLYLDCMCIDRNESTHFISLCV